MTALADHPAINAARSGAVQAEGERLALGLVGSAEPGSTATGSSGTALDGAPGKSELDMRRRDRSWPPDRQAVGSWPLMVLPAPAAVAVWSGWVRLGQMTGFGLVRPFPGLWDSFQVNTAITLPIGVEAYGAYALRAWLAAGSTTSERTRRFARWSAIGSLLLGMSGQVAYHLLTEAGVVRAPWPVTMAVACLPVLVLGMGAALSHLRHADADHEPEDDRSASPGTMGPVTLGQNGNGGRPVLAREPSGDRVLQDERHYGCATEVPERLEIARLTALQLTSTEVRVSRRTLRDAGLRGSNAELSALVKVVTSELAHDAACGELSGES